MLYPILTCAALDGLTPDTLFLTTLVGRFGTFK